MSLFSSLHLIHLMQKEMKSKKKPPLGPTKAKSLPTLSVKIWPFAYQPLLVTSGPKDKQDYY